MGSPPTPPTSPPALAATDGRDRALTPGAQRRARVAWLRAALVLVLVGAQDQLSKPGIEHSVVPGEDHSLLRGVQPVDTHNHGVAFGFRPGNQLLVTILICLAM